MDELQSMKNTNQYTVLNADRATRSMQIDLYDFATLNKVSTLIDSKNFLILPTASMLIRSRRMKKDPDCQQFQPDFPPFVYRRLFPL
jgi:hypothetical protein